MSKSILGGDNYALIKSFTALLHIVEITFGNKT